VEWRDPDFAQTLPQQPAEDADMGEDAEVSRDERRALG